MSKICVGSRIQMQGLRVAILAAGGEALGGAERFYEGLHGGFVSLGCDADLIFVSAEEPDVQTILSNYAKCGDLDLSAYDVVVSTKVPTYAVNHPNHVSYLVHTVRVFDDMFKEVFPSPTEELYAQRALVHRRDLKAILGPKARYAIGYEVARRLYRWRGVQCEVLHPPLAFHSFATGDFGDYFFLPGRLHPWKRVDLLINAIKRSDLPMKLILAGTGESERELRKLADNDERIQFLGRISDEKLVELYAGCLAVPFVPIREDYGYVTLEAFASGKPVLTATDSGEPCQFVRPYETGLIVEPHPDKVCQALEWLWLNRRAAATMGGHSRRLAEDMSWSKTAYTLAEAALGPCESNVQSKSQVLVVDMQPIDPPVGGGRLRLLGLYHGLGSGIQCTYVGSYDWRGENYRRHMLSETLCEIDIPLSDAHHDAAESLSQSAGGKVVIDLAFSRQAHLSPNYIDGIRKELENAETVVFSHPWAYQLVKGYLRPSQVIIYDSQNVEGFLRAQLLDETNPVEADLLRQVVQDENDIGWRADWILACSHEDLLRFNRIYGFPLEKLRVVPNGVMAFDRRPPSDQEKEVARRDLGIESVAFVAIFIGSEYSPNIQAVRFILDELAIKMPDILFVVAGGVGQRVKSNLKNVHITGYLGEKDKIRWLQASDIAINPMLSGSGTNIKMFDFMAMGLPVITTRIGARGIEVGGRKAFLVAEPTVLSFMSAIGQLQDVKTRTLMGRESRQCVEDGYAWERISDQLGTFIEARRKLARQSKPAFSVVVPTYERPAQLDILFTHLQNQVERDFEVIVVDQSATRWTGAELSYGFPLTYFHTPVRGAVRARNTGGMLAQGEVLAFVDDDCIPAADWLLKARAYFASNEVVGVEGLIYSDHLDDPEWRPVTNVGFEGIGFMTANMFIRSSAFQFLGGFDLQFDRPHFREDTDLGWRLLELGHVPYAADAKVFHPAQPRSEERESHQERARFFEKDALLYWKHPDLYQKLFFYERHYERTIGFTDNLLRGFSTCGVEPPAWMMPYLNSER